MIYFQSNGIVICKDLGSSPAYNQWSFFFPVTKFLLLLIKSKGQHLHHVVQYEKHTFCRDIALPQQTINYDQLKQVSIGFQFKRVIIEHTKRISEVNHFFWVSSQTSWDFRDQIICRKSLLATQ